jgi:tetratricopeptide (TPR) repeat protein
MHPVRRWWLWIYAVLLLGLAYSNHFNNSFHFDDFHTIKDNVHIRSLANMPRFFTDARTFSNLPTHQVYRPLLTASLAIDYVRRGGEPFAFHVTTFCAYILLLITIYALFLFVLDRSRPYSSNRDLALLGTAIYAVHPACAETINYIIQRADLLSTLGVTAGLVWFAWAPHARRYGFYLLPVVLGLLCKPPALIFPVLLFALTHMFESSGARNALRASVPSVIVCLAIAWVLNSMTVRSFDPGAVSAALYRLTQPYVALHYFVSFFAPVQLNADTDRRVLPGLSDPRAIIGLVFLCLIIALIWMAQRSRQTRPISFGLLWFLAALFPTSWMPLAEVANDHRMFFPFIGLTLAAVCTINHLAHLAVKSSVMVRRYGIAAAVLLLAVEARATYARNEVWRTEESVWLEVTRKSPANGRGLMNYALTQMAKGNISLALQYLERARVYNPAYFLLEINLGIAKGELGRHLEAERHFVHALAIEPARYEPHFYYARWLRGHRRVLEAIHHLEDAVRLNPYALDARHLLLSSYLDQGHFDLMRVLASATLQYVPGDRDTVQYLEISKGEDELERAKAAAHYIPTAENYLSLSLAYYRAANFEECIGAARESLKRNPEYAEAWNNIAAAHNALGGWAEAIAAADQALRLKPAFALARNNRAWAVSRQRQEVRR